MALNSIFNRDVRRNNVGHLFDQAQFAGGFVPDLLHAILVGKDATRAPSFSVR